MHIRKMRTRYVVLLALVAAGGLVLASIALAASTFSFKASPSSAPKSKYQAGSLFTDLETHYTSPGNNKPGGAVERTQIYLDKNFKVDPTAAQKCSPNQLKNQT